MDSIYAATTVAKDAVLGTDSSKSGTEPPNAQQGKGTVDEPYDQGNAPEQPVGKGIEPPNAQQGKGTVDSAYDQGNQPENPPTSTTTTTTSGQTSSVPPQSSSSETPTAPPPKPKGSGIPITLYKPPPGQDIVSDEPRGRPDTPQSTKQVEKGQGHFDPAKRDAGIRHERSISPGQLADGTHVTTSGGKGLSYEPGSGKMGKLKNKFHIGQH